MEKIISKTALHQTHISLGAKMAPFAGYDMPIQYSLGALAEHEWCRASAGLFDVSHMGQFMLTGEEGASFLSTLTPTNFEEKRLGACVYSLLMNEKGGIRDDLIATRLTESKVYVVLNAACKETDAEYIKSKLSQGVELEELAHRGLLALQGKKAVEVLQHHTEENLSEMAYMSARQMAVAGYACIVSRSGYTGEDGFEISVDEKHLVALWNTLLENPAVKPIGLAARDSLRLEAGFPLYGHDLTEETTPLEATLAWVMSKNHSGYVGEKALQKQKAEGVARKRVGVLVTERGIAREGADVLNLNGEKIGTLCSGGFSPSLKVSIGQAYLPVEYVSEGTELRVEVRGKMLAAKTANARFIKR